MLVERLLPAAHERLFTVSYSAPLIEAARLLYDAECDIIAVTDSDNRLVGILTKTDVVRQISTCQGSSCTTMVSSVMADDVVTCELSDWLHDIWEIMKDRHFKNVPILNAESQPVGILNVGDALQTLLQEVENEEKLLRDYVMCVGYQ